MGSAQIRRHQRGRPAAVGNDRLHGQGQAVRGLPGAAGLFRRRGCYQPAECPGLSTGSHRSCWRNCWMHHRKLGRELEVDEANGFRDPGASFRSVPAGSVTRARTQSRAAHCWRMGEWLSTRMGCCFLAATSDAAWVDVREALEIVPESDLSPARQWLSAAAARLKPRAWPAAGRRSARC